MSSFFIALCIAFGIYSPNPGQSDFVSNYVNKIITDAPGDLDKEVLLVPRFDFKDIENAEAGERRDFIVQFNKAAKKSNTSLNETVDKAYPYEYKLVSLSEIEAYKAEGYKYFLDMVIMPKQMSRPKKEAMVPAYKKYETANKMYRNANGQFHYYFYIRNLQTDDAYISSKMKGNWDVYRSIGGFLRQIRKDSK